MSFKTRFKSYNGDEEGVPLSTNTVVVPLPLFSLVLPGRDDNANDCTEDKMGRGDDNTNGNGDGGSRADWPSFESRRLLVSFSSSRWSSSSTVSTTGGSGTLFD